jgi:ADP-heptose:LPS heptosyltransferase
MHPKHKRNGLTVAHYRQTIHPDAGAVRTCSGHPPSAASAIRSVGLRERIHHGAILEQNAGELLRMPNVSNLCGKFSLDELAAFINAADGLIASGTGPLHMAAALGRPTLGLFPPMKPIHPGRWAPLGRAAVVLCRDKPCDDASTCACMRNTRPEQACAVAARWRRDKLQGGVREN